MTPDELDSWMTAGQAADATGYSPTHIWRLYKAGLIRTAQMGRNLLYNRADVANLPPRQKPGRKKREEGQDE